MTGQVRQKSVVNTEVFITMTLTTMTVSLATLNLYAPDVPRTPTMVEGSSGDPARAGAAMAPGSAPARELPAGTIIDAPEPKRSLPGLSEMRPVDRADAALMSVIEPDRFTAFRSALETNGDWKSILSTFSAQVPNHPEWMDAQYRLPAADVLRRTGYLEDLSQL